MIFKKLVLIILQINILSKHKQILWIFIAPTNKHTKQKSD